MKLRTRLPSLPRASTNASVATLTPNDQLPSKSVPEREPGVSGEQCTQILQQLQLFDTEGVFTGALTPDGRLAADGPLVTYNLRSLQSDFANAKLSVESVPAAFREMCQAAILHWWSSNRQRALYTNSLLNFGNQQFQAFTPVQSSFAGTESATADSFWLAAPVFNNLLAFNYPVSALPADFQVGVQRPTHRKMDGQKRQHPESGSPTYQRLKKSKSGLGRQAPRQQGDQKGRMAHMPELSSKLQKRLATLLVLVTADAEPETSGRKQEPVESDATKQEAPSLNSIKQEAQSPNAFAAGSVTGNKGIHGHAHRVRQSSAAEQSQMLKISFQSIAAGLHASSYQSQEVVKQDIQEICRSAAEAFSSQDQESNVRRGKVLAAADQYAQLINGAIETIVEQSFSSKHLAKSTDSSSQPVVRHIPLPPSIIANTEPFRHGDWRKEPYPTRRYKRLTEYELPEEQALLKWKLQTSKKGGCQGQSCKPGQLGTYSMELGAFQTKCPCLAQNTECDAACTCAPPGNEAGAAQGCANRAASMRRVLQLGKDVQEIDSWGLDCYTRKNIHDAVLESQAFGPSQARRDNSQAQSSGAKSETPGQIGGVQLDAATPAGHAMQQATHAEEGGPGQSSDLKAAITDWLDKVFLPAINAEGLQGWDILRACVAVKKAAQDKGFEAGVKAAAAIHKRASRVGHDFFRIHPKGVGLICLRPEGLPPLTLVEEYLGEMHAPWRWFEIQDAIKKTSKDELPDFYNIQLERPKDDDKGYDVLFIDAASKGSFASRISHSCSPNCQAQVMACGGRLTIALYTMRHVALGEELTFDYASVTESEREFRAAICLCGSQLCRGSFLYFSGSKAFMQIMVREHNMLHRQALILRAATFPLNDKDRQRLKERGVGESALRGRSRTAWVPEWLEKWAALIMEYVETEQAMLPLELLALRPPYATYTPASAAAEAKGVSDNRLQNVVITLDKVKLCLERPEYICSLTVQGPNPAVVAVIKPAQYGNCIAALERPHVCPIIRNATRHLSLESVTNLRQPQGPPLRMATDQEVLQHLWTGERSVARRLLRCAASLLSDGQAVRALTAADTAAQIQAAMRRYGPSYPELQRLADVVAQQVNTPQEAKAQLLLMVDVLRDLDVQHKGGHTAAADMAYLYAMTQVWFTVERNYKGFSSPRVRLPVEAPLQEYGGALTDTDTPSSSTGPPPSRRQRPLREVLANGTNSMQLDSAASLSGSDQEQSPESVHRPASAAGKPVKTKSRLGRSRPTSHDLPDVDPELDPSAGNDPLFDPASEALPVSRPHQTAPRTQGRTASSSLAKKYGALFIWGQLSGWFKQTVYDPTASLSAERRGTLSLPDPDSCYGSGRQYTLKERDEVIQHIDKRPEAMWKINTMWSFRNEAKMYGSPMFDAVWAKVTLSCSNKMPEVVQALRQASLPRQYHRP